MFDDRLDFVLSGVWIIYVSILLQYALLRFKNNFLIDIYVFLLVLIEGRKYSHDTVDMTGINVMLNTKDVSEYLKISPNGLEVFFFFIYR